MRKVVSPMHLKLTVSQIADITGVPARTIRYYNQIGLFTANGVLKNGYRYFSVEKIEELRMINYLRYTGLSINKTTIQQPPHQRLRPAAALTP